MAGRIDIEMVPPRSTDTSSPTTNSAPSRYLPTSLQSCDAGAAGATMAQARRTRLADILKSQCAQSGREQDLGITQPNSGWDFPRPPTSSMRQSKTRPRQDPQSGLSSLVLGRVLFEVPWNFPGCPINCSLPELAELQADRKSCPEARLRSSLQNIPKYDLRNARKLGCNNVYPQFALTIAPETFQGRSPPCIRRDCVAQASDKTPAHFAK